MKKIIDNTKKIIFLKQKDIFSSAIILALMILISRIFGFLRYRALTGFFSKEELDLFFAAFRLPDLIFEILISGALSSAFIPIFIKNRKDKDQLEKSISSIVNFLFIGLLFFIFLVFLLADKIIPLTVPGYQKDKINYIITFSRTLLITQLPFLFISNILSGIAQANKIFIITTIAPIIYNLTIIFGTIIFSKNLWLYGPILGVILGSFLFFASQIPVVFIINFKYRFFCLEIKALSEFIKLFIPRVLTVITSQIDLTIDLILSSFLGAGSYTSFFFAQHFQLFPVSLIGITLGQASLPYLTELFEEKKIDQIKKIFVNSILQMIFLTTPLSIFFTLTRIPLVRIFFGGQKFDWEGTVMTATALSYFCLSLPFHSVFYIIIRAFYATHDTKTPFFINLFSVVLNTFLSFYFVFILTLPVWSLAISFSISIVTNVIILLAFFYQKINGFEIKKIFWESLKIYFASFFAFAISYPLMKVIDGLILDTSRTINVFFLLVILFFSFSVIYLFLAWLLNIEEIYIFQKLIKKIKELKKEIFEVYTETG